MHADGHERPAGILRGVAGGKNEGVEGKIYIKVISNSVEGPMAVVLRASSKCSYILNLRWFKAMYKDLTAEPTSSGDSRCWAVLAVWCKIEINRFFESSGNHGCT